MSGFDDLLNPSNEKLLGTEYTFRDADTLEDAEGNGYRIQGVNAPEVVHGDRGEQEVGGYKTTSEVMRLANELGFTNVIKTGEMDVTGTREMIDLRNDAGQSFREAVGRAGLLQVEAGFDPGGHLQASADYGNFLRTHPDYEQNEWDKAAAAVMDAVKQQQKYNNQFRRAQLYAGEAANLAAAGVNTKHINREVADFVRADIDTATGESNNPLSDAWDTGLIGVQEGLYGAIEMLGETTDYDALANIGEAGIERARTRIGDRGTLILSYKDVDGFGDAMEFIGNNALISLPYMAISMGAAVAAPVTGGLSLSAPAAVYAGQTWNEMEGDKNAGIAVASGVAQAALDRLGLKFLVAPGKASKQLLKEATEELVKGGMTKEAAQETVMQATRRELAGFVGDAAKVAAQQLQAKNMFKQAAARMAVGTTGEAMTEAMQELTAYAGAVFGSDKTWDWNEVNERAINAVIAGGTLGGTFTVPGTLYDAGAWADVAVREGAADATRLSTAGKYAEQETAQFGRVASNQENAARARAQGLAAGPNAFPSLNERAEEHKKTKKDRTFGETFFDTVTSAPHLWRGAVRNIFTPDVLARSRSARIMADMFGGGLQKTFSGATYENQKHHNVTIYKNMVDDPQAVYAAFNGGQRVSRASKKTEISDRIYAKLRNAIENGKFNPDLIPDTDPEKRPLVALQQQLQRLADKMYDDQVQYNPDLGKLNNYLLRYKAFNKKAIVDNKPRFVSLLAKEFGMPEADAQAIADSITDSQDINDISDALTAHGAAGHPGSHKQRTLDLAEKPEFAEFMDNDIFSNVSSAARSAARYTAYEQFIGKDNVVVNQLLNQMQAEGLSPEEINRIASMMKDYLDAESGNYKRPKTPAGKRLQDVQRSFMMVTTLAGLPLATISSFVELALSMRALTMDQILGKKGKKGGLHALGNELGHTLWTGIKEVGSVAHSKPIYPPATQGKEMLKSLGFYDWSVGAATTTGVTEIKPWQQTIYESFFKWIGLQGWTNYTRSIRASIAGDYISDKLDIILNQGPVKTNEVQEAEESLRNLGVNVDDMLAAYMGGGMFDPNQATVIEENFREGTFNFINDAVALPQSANRPLIYQDPRFALFTQFQGFIATFTANHIPKLWGEYVARGTPAMKYNAFAIMTTMIMLGFASQYLKDLIKYGKAMDFGPGDHPFLSTSEYVQRGIRSSGLLGTGERVLDQFFPLYEQRSNNAGEWVYHGVTGESPALSYADKLFRGVGKGLTGDIGEASKDLSRFVPFVGTINWIRKEIGNTAGSWNFNGS